MRWVRSQAENDALGNEFGLRDWFVAFGKQILGNEYASGSDGHAGKKLSAGKVTKLRHRGSFFHRALRDLP